MYLRKSRSEEQADLAQTLKRHRETLLAFAQGHGYDIQDVYEEVVSGESLYARPRMLELLQRVEAGAYGAVLCMDIDRLGRGGMRDQGIILDAFKYSGTKIVTPDRIYDLNDETDEELTEFKTFLSRREYKIINKRLQRGLRRTLEDGGYIANPPFGYRRDVRDRKPTLAVDEEEANFVRLIFRLYVEEGMGTSSIADTLNALGVRPRRAGQFCRTSVGLILKNPVYTGKIVWNRRKKTRSGGCGERPQSQVQPREEWLVADGLHPSIIAEEQFELAQEIMRSRAHPSAPKPGIRNPMAGLIRCAVCGQIMQRRGGSASPYLLCPTPGCVTGSRADAVEQALLRHLRDDLQVVRWSICAEEDDGRRLAQTAAERECRELRAQIGRLYDLLERGTYDDATFHARREELGQRLSQAQSLCSRWKEAPDGITGGTVYDTYQACDAAGRNRLLHAILDYAEYDKEKGGSPTDFTLVLHLKPF